MNDAVHTFCFNGSISDVKKIYNTRMPGGKMNILHLYKMCMKHIPVGLIYCRRRRRCRWCTLPVWPALKLAIL